MEEQMIYETLLEAEDARDLHLDQQLDEGLDVPLEDMIAVSTDHYFANDEATSSEVDTTPDLQADRMEFDAMFDTSNTELFDLDFKPTITIVPEPQMMMTSEVITQAPKRTRKNSNTSVQDERHKDRLESNKRSAQLSRDRKKAQRGILESNLVQLTSERKSIGDEIAKLQTENEILKKELVSLQDIVGRSPSLTKIMERSQSQALTVMSKSEPQNDPQGAASWYTLIMMHIFSQYFQQTLAGQSSLTSVPPSPKWVQ